MKRIKVKKAFLHKILKNLFFEFEINDNLFVNFKINL